jgi:CAAX prenyl protease-like protein
MPRINYRELSSSDPPRGGGFQAWLADRPQMPYLIPFFAYLIIMSPAGLGTVAGIDFTALWKSWHPVIYAAKSAVAAILLWYFWPWYTRIRWTHLPLGIVVGLIGTPLWIATHYICLRSGLWHPITDAYNPDLMLSTEPQRLAFLCIRIVGPSLVVPFMEELFFRDFLMRALVRGARFDDVPVGSFTWLSLLGMSLLFGINHGSMWPAGILYGLLMGILLIRTKSLGACIVAHGVTNWSLYLYVIYTGDWQFM